MKTYIGISRDHSGSMHNIAKAATSDYNSKITAIKTAATLQNMDTIVSVVECGSQRTDRVRRVITNSAVATLTPITHYETDGVGTPLWDSVGELIEMFESTPDAMNKDVSFLVMAITDGEENSSRKYDSKILAKKIKTLEATDRWTFVFRVPIGSGDRICQRLGVHPGNVQEWEQTNAGVEKAASLDSEAFTTFFADRSSGKTATKKFYTNLKDVSLTDINIQMTDVSKEVMLFPVSLNEDGADIRSFIESRLNGRPMLKGSGFYQLTKTEPKVQANKKILIRDKDTQAVFYGAAARKLLGLPTFGTVRVAPGEHGQFDIFIQSTSVNRKMSKGTTLIYWENVGTSYKEGISAR